MRVCFFGTYERDYPRNQILIKALRSEEIDFFECHFNLWKTKPHKTELLSNLFVSITTALRMATAYFFLAVRYLFAPSHDIVLFGYPGHLDVILLGWLPKLFNRSIVFDCFISLYDTAISDRKLARPDSFRSQFLQAIDRTACAQSNFIILDTNAHIDFFVNQFKLPKNKFKRIFAGADTELFTDDSMRINSQNNVFRVLFIGKFTPLHGIDVILEAAQKLLTHTEIKFEIVGTGQMFTELKAKAHDLKLRNVNFFGWLPYEQLPAAISKSDLCLGIFSDSEKANRVIPNKIFQAMSCGKPVLTTRTDACKELFIEDESIFYVKPNDSAELADKLVSLSQNQSSLAEVAKRGRETVLSKASAEVTARNLKQIFLDLSKGSRL